MKFTPNRFTPSFSSVPKLAALLVLGGVGFHQAQAATVTWNGSSSLNGNWATAANWAGGGAPVNADNLIFAGSTRLTPVNSLTAGTSFGNLSFSSTAGAFTLSGNSIALTGSVTNSSSNTQTIATDISLTSGVHTFTTTAGIVDSGTISGTGGALTKSGTGTLTLTGANSYTGATLISAGALNVQHATGLGTTGGGTSVSSGAALQLQGGITIGAEALSLSGTGVSANGALRNISGNNTYRGLITLGANSRINSDLGTLTLDVASGNAITGTYNLTFGGAGNTTVADAIAISTGSLTKDGAGTLTLTAANSYSGGTTISNGTLSVGRGSVSGSIAGNVTNDGTLVFNRSNALTYGGIISGTGAVTKSGAGTLTLTGANTYSGATTIGAGILSVNGSTSSTSAVAVLDTATLGGSGTVGGNATVASGGTLAPGNSPGVLTISGTTTLETGSVFEWQLDTAQADPTTNRGTAYDGINTSALAGDGAIFHIMLTGLQDFTDDFWSQSREWTDIFQSADGSTELADWTSVFGGGFQYSYNGQTVAPTTGGSFTMTGNSLSWSAVPEPSSALAGLAILAGLIHHRRRLTLA